MNNKSGIISFFSLNLLILIFIFCPVSASAVKPDWNVGFQSVFDNREGSSTLTETKTVFFTALSPEVGLRLTKKDRIAVGAVWTVPNAQDWKEHRLVPTLYYRHVGKRWNFSMGLFPRTQLHEELPEFLWTDSLAYFQKNIRGMLVQYHNGMSFIDFYLDWRQMQTETRREAFNLVLHGQWQPKGKVIFAGGHVMMNHYALTKNSPEDMHIVDDFLVNPYVGIDLGKMTPLDSLSFRAGALMNIERNRARANWSARAGVNFEGVAKWKWIGLRESLYYGAKLLPSFAEFGNSLYPAHPFYQGKFFSRTDVNFYFYRNKYVDVHAKLRFDVAPGQFVFSQLAGVDINIGGKW